MGAAAAGVGAAGVVVGVGGTVGVGGCCSGPGHSKRRRQAPGVGAVGGGSPEREEVGAGYNSEDEYEAAAARIEAMDPATVEQVWAGRGVTGEWVWWMESPDRVKTQGRLF